jgi:hypothetical protein
LGRQKSEPAFALCIAAFLCLDFLFLFHLSKKKVEKKKNLAISLPTLYIITTVKKSLTSI